MRDFSWKRVGLLITHKLPSDLVPLGIGAAALLSIEVLGWLVSGNWGVPFGHNPEGAPWPGLVILACFLISSRGFQAMNSARSGTDWLLLPATPLEKSLASVLETQVLIPVVASCLGLLLWASTGSFAFPRSFEVWEAWGLFVVMNLIFLAGSTVFRKLAFIKTSAAGLAFLVVMLAFPIVVLRQWNGGPGPDFAFPLGMSPSESVETFLNVLWHLGVFVVTPVATLAFGYFRVREKEARDAVQ